MTCQTLLNHKTEAKTRVGCAWFSLPTHAIKATPLAKICKVLPFSEPKQPTAEKTGFEGVGEVGLRSPGQIRDEHDEGFQETCRAREDSKGSPMTNEDPRGGNEICGRPEQQQPWASRGVASRWSSGDFSLCSKKPSPAITSFHHHHTRHGDER
jgi:hypothetical protein